MKWKPLLGEQGEGERKESGEAKGTKQAGFWSRMLVGHFFSFEKHNQNIFGWQKEFRNDLCRH